MKINTKEKYDRLKEPLKPKAKVIKDRARKTFQSLRFTSTTKKIPFIPRKDRSSEPFDTRKLKKPFTLHDLFRSYFSYAPLAATAFRGQSSSAGRRKHAGEVRRVKKHQRYRQHMRSLRA